MDVNQAINNWLNDPAIAESDKQEIRDLQDAGNHTELVNRFYQTLEFGTGGLRGIIGAGINRMNIYTVGAAAQGMANYIARQGEAARQAGVVIAFDCRRMSDTFAERTASVMAGNGIKAYLFESLRPTPELSFAVRHLGCTAGVVITASHNPPEYNGFKAYWSDGVQVVPPHDAAIIDEVNSVGGFGNVHSMPIDEAKQKGMVVVIGKEADEAFLGEVEASCLNPKLSADYGPRVKIVFTGLHGTGSVLCPEALRRRGFTNVLEVPEQKDPDGEFPTVKSPNPEEGAALDLAIKLAEKENADLVIGTDPDADRMGIAVRKPEGGFELVTGNRIAALLTYYICEQLQAAGRFPSNAALVTTVVSGDMMKDIACSYGAEVIETLTGFKWIGQKVCEFEAKGSPGSPSRTYIFGAEESYGYMPATFTRDKDAVTSSAYIADLAALAASRNQSLHGLLESLFQQFGYYQEGAKSVVLPGKEGADKIRAMMEKVRTDPPESLGGLKVVAVTDFQTGEKKDRATGEVIERFNLPSSNVVMFVLEDGSKAIARPSGTEPKIKFYILTRDDTEDLETARTNATKRIEAIAEDLTSSA